MLLALTAGLQGPAVGRAQPDCDTYASPDAPCALADGSVISASIGARGGRNYFWFGVPVPDMHVSIQLTDLPADYDLYLFSDQVADPEQPILSSITHGTAPEDIDAVLHDVGTYVVEVVDDPSIPNVPDVPYTLSFRLSPPPAAPTPEPTPEPTPLPTAPPVPAPSLVAVPAVVGQTPNNGARLMHDAGLVVDVADADAFSPAGPGTVATQDPQAGTRVAPGSTVKLGIASGRVAVPDVRGRSESEASAILRAAGFNIQTRRRPDDTVPSGTAVGTNPGAGSVLGAASSIELLVSQGH